MKSEPWFTAKRLPCTQGNQGTDFVTTAGAQPSAGHRHKAASHSACHFAASLNLMLHILSLIYSPAIYRLSLSLVPKNLHVPHRIHSQQWLESMVETVIWCFPAQAVDQRLLSLVHQVQFLNLAGLNRKLPALETECRLFQNLLYLQSCLMYILNQVTFVLPYVSICLAWQSFMRSSLFILLYSAIPE